MLGYKYNTIQEVQEAQSLCDMFYGYPKENSITQHWIDYNFDGFYYIIFDESIKELLGNPIEFEITIPNHF